MSETICPVIKEIGDHIEEKKLTHKCGSCGHTGTDVLIRHRYIGGQGFVRVYECDNLPDCWTRMGWGRPCPFTEEYCPSVKECKKCETCLEAKK